MFLRVIRTEIGGLRAEIGGEIGSLRAEISGIHHRLDADVSALMKHAFGIDRG